MSLPVGIQESLQRVDEGLAASEGDVQSLFDLLHHDGEVAPAVTSFLKRKQGQLGYLREDFRGISERLGGPA